MYDIIIIGSGIGGTLFAALNHKKHHLLLFEKDANVGGCCSTFKRFGRYYNTGATTFVGYEEGHVVKRLFDQIGYAPELIESKVGLRIAQNGKEVDRVQEFDSFLKEIEQHYPNPNNTLFWHTIKEIDEKFWKLKKLYYAKHTLLGYLKSLASIIELLRVYKWHPFMSAQRFIQKTLGDISTEYQAFIDAQLLITLQTKSENLSLLTMALGLAYPFHKTYYVKGGMGAMIEGLLAGVPHKKEEEIVTIVQHHDSYEVRSTKGCYRTKNIILNTTIYQSTRLFQNQAIQDYYKQFRFSDQSAFMVYMRVKSKARFLHHYQVILDQFIPNTISHAFFISFSDISDKKLTHDGYSVTISTHTKASFWKGLSKEEYRCKKMETQDYLTEAFLDYFGTILQKEDIERVFSATSNTFHRYIGRYNCGGEAFKMKNILSIPSCTTPFKGLYHVGDTVFAGQGWPGVALGVEVLDKVFNDG